jgi:outer membrane receptor protein involved in Fe transport
MPRRHHHYGKLAAAISATLYATTGLLAVSTRTQDAPAEEEVAPAASGAPDPAVDIVTVTGDPLRALGSGPTESSFGFAKSLLETPRAVSFISEEQITLFGISTVEDLTRLVAGTYTTARDGLQGGINVRGVPSDMYYRGMKRLQMRSRPHRALRDGRHPRSSGPAVADLRHGPHRRFPKFHAQVEPRIDGQLHARDAGLPADDSRVV